MNKSLVFKNKFYLFISFLFSFFLFLYLTHFVINGERGILSYLSLKKINDKNIEKIFILSKKNEYLEDKIERLQPDTIDLDYLDEKLRENTGFLKENEITIIFD